MKTKIKKIFFGVYLLLASITTRPCQQEQQPEVWINIFTHGIMSIKPHLSISNFIRFMTDNIQDSVYSTTVELMRNDPLFYQNQAMQEIGLKPISMEVLRGNASGAMAKVFETMSCFVNKTCPPKNYYYTYGWSGLLSQKSRYLDAQLLRNAINKLLEEFAQRNITPKIRLIGYSHGGNVLLYLGQVRQREPHITRFNIDELILLGMPVQSETDFLITDPIFKAIYHIYSRGDRIQKLDFFSLNRFFSRRIFKGRKEFELPNKLIQIQLKCTRTSTLAKNSEDKIAAGYQLHNQAVLSGKSRYLRDASPGHTELWFFSWTPANYRPHFPLNPLPAACLIPLIVHEARNFADMKWSQKPTLIDIRPEHELVIIKNQKSKQVLAIAEFLPIGEQQKINNMVMTYAPENYTDKRYVEHIEKAYNKALEIRRPVTKKHRCGKRLKQVACTA